MKKKIALVTGGYSGEAAISYKSAVTIYNNLDKEIFDVFTIDINPEGWFYVDIANKNQIKTIKPMPKSIFNQRGLRVIRLNNAYFILMCNINKMTGVT